ncbi:tetratricopeptide tpr_2 [Bacillus sp. OxB-1]|uniref:tetratricopeptide repeat protein n=1 Tax=Bacillus sp. (strain OxB-1) TaxID=98228 RepID=UPI0005823231|nr:tetratricopeptide repeat protein [Bacillus sp. OxB-1]BAQ09840.1 tetratricopeptide tpr_2 [Bacillus sp. OxB-1]
MNLNQQAIQLLEANQYDEALELFQEAVRRSRDVQSLTNLAWIYCHEEDEFEKALELAEEAIALKPSSHFPYYLQGELYGRLERWEEAKSAWEQALAIHESKTAWHNLAVASYELGKTAEASEQFRCAAGKSDTALYGHAKCLADLGKRNAAKQVLATFAKEDDEFVGEVEVADLYVEIGAYKEAVYWFAIGWDNYWKQPSWVGRYVFALRKLDRTQLAEDVLNEARQLKEVEWQESVEEDCDEDWTPRDKEENLERLRDDMKLYEQISDGYVPALEFGTYLDTACYLFGCARHGHPEYQG